MKKTVWTCGLIAGLLVTLWMFYHMLNPGPFMDPEYGMVFGYATMVLAFTLIFVAIRNYRDRHNGGVVTFGKAFLVGLYVTLIASTMYVLVWMVDFHFFNPDYLDVYTSTEIKSLREQGVSEDMIVVKEKEMRELGDLYKNNLLVMAAFTYMEILPVGLLVSVIAALVLRRKRVVDGE